jgi:hypothetical protein
MSTPKSIVWFCTQCRRKLKVPSAYLGQMVICNHCNHQFRVEEPAAPGSGSESESVELELETARKENGRLMMALQVLETERVAEAERVGRYAEALVAVTAERDRSADELRAAREERKHLEARLSENARLEAALRQFEADSQACRARIDDLEGDLAGARAERDLTLAKWTRLEAEHDRCAERESQWERMLGENECRHRTEIDDLAHELRIAGNQGRVAAQHEHAITEQLQIANRELNATRTERDRLAGQCSEAERMLHSIKGQLRDQGELLQNALLEASRWEGIANEREAMLTGQIDYLQTAVDQYKEQLESQQSAHREESKALARELEAKFGQRMAEEAIRASALAEQLEAFRAELEQSVQGPGKGRIGAPKSTDGPDFDAEPDRDFDAELDSQGIPNEPERGGDEAALPGQPSAAPDGWSGHAVAGAWRFELAPPAPPAFVEDSPICLEVNSVVEPESHSIASRRSLAAESPEARILHLRNSLRLAHEAHAKGPSTWPFLARLARIWKKNGSPR